MKLSDQELLKELEQRFNQRNKMIEEQKKFVVDLEKVNARLLESEKLKSDFLSNIKNEINNPITAMLGLLKMILTQPDNENNASLTRLVYNETFILNFHLKNIFNAAEIEAGQSVPDVSNVNVHKIITRTSESFEEFYEKKNIRIKIPDSELHFMTDGSKLELILSNLISNAVKFSQDDSEVHIYAEKLDDKLTITVQDFGKGIEPEMINAIFDRFKQLDTGTTKAFGGHGLGLSVVQSIVDILNGEVTVESEVGEGTTFKIILPAGSSDRTEADEDVLLFDDTDVKEEIF